MQNPGYPMNTYIYSGKGSDEKTLTEQKIKLQIPTQSVLRLIQPVANLIDI